MKRIRFRIIAFFLAAVIAVSASGCSVVTDFLNKIKLTDETSVADETSATEETGEGAEHSGAVGETTEQYYEEPQETVEEFLKKIAGKKVFRFSQTTAIGLYDPALATSIPDTTVLYHLYEGLYRTVGGETVPAGATSVDISEDGLTYTFHLRPEAKWSDGAQVTAYDYQYGIRRSMSPATKSPTAYVGDILQNGAQVRKGEAPLEALGVEAVDDLTLALTLTHPSDTFLHLLQQGVFCPVRQDCAQQYGDRFAKTPHRAVYNGPFALRLLGGRRIVLEKNANYWDAGSVGLDYVVISAGMDDETAYQLYLKGELDYCEIPAMHAEENPDAPRVIDGTMTFIAANFGSGLMANRNLRLAVSTAMSRLDMANMFQGRVALRLVLPEASGVDGMTYGELYPYECAAKSSNDKLAREYLAAACEELGCKPEDIVITAVAPDSKGSSTVAKLFRKQLDEVLGVTLQLSMIPYDVRNEMMISGMEDYDLMFTGWSADYPDAYNYLELFRSGSAFNFIGYSNPAYDELMDESLQLSGRDRLDRLFEAEKILLEDNAVFPWLEQETQYLLAPGFSGIHKTWAGHTIEFLHGDCN